MRNRVGSREVHVMSVRAWSILLAAVVAAGVVVGQEAPPRDLRWQGDHWTAWSPPPPPAGAQVYAIQPGDTLWDLAGRFYGDPYLWPQLWEQNQYILDAHWIYPGDPLVVTGLAEGVTETPEIVAPPLDLGEAAPPAGAEEAEAAEAAEEAVPRIGRSVVSGSSGPVPLGHESDIYCSGFIGAPDEPFAYSIVGSEYDYLTPSLEAGKVSQLDGTFGKAETEKVGLSIGDVAYLDGGRADGLSAGELLTAVQPGRMVRHPRTGAPLGRFYQYVGRVRVLSVQETTAIAEVVMACDMVRVGSRLQLFEPEPVPLRRLTPVRPVNYPAPASEVDAGATIVFARDATHTLGTGHLVFIDRGAEDDVAPGDIYTIYRRARPGFPPIVLGEVGVLSVHRTTALARILSSRYTVYIGDALVPK